MNELITALSKQEREAGRVVMVLYPSKVVHGNEHAWLRSSKNHCGLKSLAIDTLIIVDEEDCDPVGVILAKQKLSGCLHPKVYSIGLKQGEALRDDLYL